MEASVAVAIATCGTSPMIAASYPVVPAVGARREARLLVFVFLGSTPNNAGGVVMRALKGIPRRMMIYVGR